MLERAAIVQCLLEEAKDPWIARALLQTLLPGLVAVARQLRFGDGVVDDPGETVSVAVASLAELIHDWAGQSRPFAGPDLLSALRGRLRRWLLKEKRARADVTPTPEEPATENSGLRTRLETLCTGTSERLARLTYARVFEGRSLAELAQADHSTSASLRQELRQFASRHLI